MVWADDQVAFPMPCDAAVVLAVLTYTTRPLDQAWKRRLVELGDRRVTAEGLGPVFASMVLDRRVPADRRRADVLLGVTR